MRLPAYGNTARLLRIVLRVDGAPLICCDDAVDLHRAQRQTHTRTKDESPRKQLPQKGPTGDLRIDATNLVVQH